MNPTKAQIRYSLTMLCLNCITIGAALAMLVHSWAR